MRMLEAARRRRALVYGLYLLLCAEAGAKLVLLTPWARARLPSDRELGWRARWVGRYLFTDRPIFYSFDVFDPTKGWALRPGLRGDRQLRGGAISSNSRGIRGRAEHEPGRVPGRRRVVVLGDSFTFGEGVGDEETYSHRLQELLGPGCEVINLGVHGYGHDQMLIRLREEGLRYAPDLVLLGFYADDASRNELRFRDYAKPRFRLRGGALVLEQGPVPPPRTMLLREALRSHLLDLLDLGWSRLRGSETEPGERRALMEALLDEMRRTSESAGARFALVDLPPLDEIAESPAIGRSEAPLLEYASRRGLIVCRTRAELARMPSSGARPGGHYDAARHAAVARVLFGCLSAAGLLAPAPSSDPPRGP